MIFTTVFEIRKKMDLPTLGTIWEDKYKDYREYVLFAWGSEEARMVLLTGKAKNKGENDKKRDSSNSLTAMIGRSYDGKEDACLLFISQDTGGKFFRYVYGINNRMMTLFTYPTLRLHKGVDCLILTKKTGLLSLGEANNIKAAQELAEKGELMRTLFEKGILAKLPGYKEDEEVCLFMKHKRGRQESNTLEHTLAGAFLIGIDKTVFKKGEMVSLVLSGGKKVRGKVVSIKEDGIKFQEYGKARRKTEVGNPRLIKYKSIFGGKIEIK